MRYNYYVNTTKYDFKERKMFCKHCGKNIYDLEKCPFCNDGEKLDGQASEKTVDTEEPKTTEAANESAEATQKKDATKPQENESTVASKENASKSFINPYEPTKETKSFHSRLKDECKGYRVLKGFIVATYVIMAVGLIPSLILSFIQNSNEKIMYCVLVGLQKSLNISVQLLILRCLLYTIMMIVFVSQMKKKNPSNKELFRGVYYIDGNGSEAKPDDIEATMFEGDGFDSWHGIFYKYSRSSFVQTIIQNIISVVEIILIGIAANLAFADALPAVRTMGLIDGITRALTIFDVRTPDFYVFMGFFVIFAIIGIIDNGVLKAMIKSDKEILKGKLRKGELENVNQENKNEQ